MKRSLGLQFPEIEITCIAGTQQPYNDQSFYFVIVVGQPRR